MVTALTAAPVSDQTSARGDGSSRSASSVMVFSVFSGCSIRLSRSNARLYAISLFRA